MMKTSLWLKTYSILMVILILSSNQGIANPLACEAVLREGIPSDDTASFNRAQQEIGQKKIDLSGLEFESIAGVENGIAMFAIGSSPEIRGNLFNRVRSGWRQIIDGPIFRDSKGVPKFIQLKFPNSGDFQTALVVANGKISLVSNFSDPGKPETISELGSDALPIRDIITRRVRKIPIPKNHRDINIFVSSRVSDSGKHLVALSVRNQPSQQNAGMTIAFLVGLDSSKAKVSIREAVIVDYDFHSVEELRKIVLTNHSSGYSIISREIIGSLAKSTQGAKFGDHIESFFRLIEDGISRMVRSKSLNGLRAAYEGSDVTGVYDMETGRVEVKGEVTQKYDSVGGVAVVQHYPISAEGTAYFTITNGPTGIRRNVEGLISLSESGAANYWMSEVPNVGVIDFYDGGKFFGGRIKSLKAGVAIYEFRIEKDYFFNAFGISQESELKGLQLAFAENQAKDQFEKKMFLIVSLTAKAAKSRTTQAKKKRPNSENGGQAELKSPFQDSTDAAGTLKKGTYAIPLFTADGRTLGANSKIAAFLLSGNVYTAADLSQRISKAGDNTLVFDNDTPTGKIGLIYRQAYDISKPHLDLEGSTEDNLRFKYKAPSATYSFANSIVFAEFNAIPKGAQGPTGIYLNVQEGGITGNEPVYSPEYDQPGPVAFIGQILRFPKKAKVEDADRFQIKRRDQLKDWVLAEATVRDPFEAPAEGSSYASAATLSFVALDGAFSRGSEGFELYLFTKGESNVPARGRLIANFKVPFQNIESAITLRGKNAYSNMVVLVVSGRKNKDSNKAHSPGDESKYFTNFYRIKYKDGEKSKNGLFEIRSLTQDGDLIDERSIKDRVGYNTDGIPFFSITPGLTKDAMAFEVLDLENFDRVRPNGSDEKRYKLDFAAYRGESLAPISVEDSWRVFASEVRKEHPNIGMSASIAQFDSFQELGRMLDEMADSSRAPSRLIMVVPSTLRELVYDFIINKGTEGEKDYRPDRMARNQGLFSNINPNLDLFIPTKERLSQEQIIANLKAWAIMHHMFPKVRSMMVMKFSELLSVSSNNNSGIPLPKKGDQFQIDDMVSAGDNGSGNIDVSVVKKYPHFLYLIAAGGKVPINEFRSNPPKAEASSVIIMTPEEMKQLNGLAAPELEAGMLKAYRVIEIRDPDENAMKQFLRQSFSGPEIQKLGLKFSAEKIRPIAGMSPEEEFGTIIEYAVSRFTALVAQKKESKFEAFMRFRAVFLSALVLDREVRASRLIDKRFIERVATQVFDIPMNREILPPNDPLNILSRPDAILKLQEAGYFGPFEFKEKIIRTLLAQTRADAGKSIPSSLLVFGGSGTGKTKLFFSVAKMLSLSFYDFQDPSKNADATAFYLNAAKVSDGSAEGFIDVEVALANLNAFIASPNGSRGHILIDDIQSAPEKVKARLLSFVRTMFEAEGGLISLKVNRQQIKKPVRNITLWVTMNPTTDQELIGKFAKNKYAPTVEELIMATLTSEHYKFEPSLLRRFGQILNVDIMPAGAKGPELIRQLAVPLRDLLTSSMRVAMVDPRIISDLVSEYVDVDARNFLSSSTDALLDRANRDPSSPVVMLVPTTVGTAKEQPEALDGINVSSAEKIAHWIDRQTRVLAIRPNDIEGRAWFTTYLANGFRIPCLEAIVMAFLEEGSFALAPHAKMNVLAPILFAFRDHVSDRDYVDVLDLNLSAARFGFKSGAERDHFKQQVALLSRPNSKQYIPMEVLRADVGVNTWELVYKQAGKSDTPVRKVISKLKQGIATLLHKRLADQIQVSSLDHFESPTAWLHQLKPVNDAQEKNKEFGKATAREFINFLREIQSPAVQSYVLSSGKPISIYDATRIFLAIVDQTAYEIPWVDVGEFLRRAMEEVTKDQVLSQRHGVQDFFFENSDRLIRPVLIDFVKLVISSVGLDELYSPSVIKQLRTSYESKFLNPMKASE